MGWKVIFAPRSESDLANIVGYIAKDDSAAAVRFGETLIAKAESLADTPEMGPILPGKPSVRFLPVGSYLILSTGLTNLTKLCASSDFGILRGARGRRDKSCVP